MRFVAADAAANRLLKVAQPRTNSRGQAKIVGFVKIPVAVGIRRNGREGVARGDVVWD
jgi:hypothetical protein